VRSPFSRIDGCQQIWRQRPERLHASLNPTFQLFVRNAPGGPVSAGRTPLHRNSRGINELTELGCYVADHGE
jgi:hypothetical protein